jgi:anti-sigma factor RsiW
MAGDRSEMTCRELVDFLGAYFDGELSEDVRGRFEEHLAACPECTAYVATYRDTVKLAKRAFQDPDDPVPAGVPDDLVRAILAARKKR